LIIFYKISIFIIILSCALKHMTDLMECKKQALKFYNLFNRLKNIDIKATLNFIYQQKR